MAEALIDGAGSGYLARVGPDGRLWVDADLNDNPATGFNPHTTLVYIASGTSTGVTGSAIGSIIKYTTTGSIIKVLGYTNNNLVSIGSWV
jgi:hypothetical protein